MKQMAMQGLPTRGGWRLGRGVCACALAALAGCAVGPDFHKPAAPAVLAYTRDAATEAAAAGGQAPAAPRPLRWWHTLGSAELDDLVASALERSPTVASAQAALRQAQANTAAQAGAFFPQVQGAYSVSRQKNPIGTVSPTLSSGQALYTLHTAQLDISYAPDFFGLNRRQLESQRAQEQAQRYELAAARQTLAANLVAAVIQAAALQEQIKLAREGVDTGEQALAGLKRQQALGYAGALDVATQESALAQARQVLPGLSRQLEQTRDLIAVLCGTPPSQWVAPPITLAELKLEQPVALSLPSQLVEQRPDVMAAQAQLHAATAQVGVALANRLPQLTLSASQGGSATVFSRMFSDGNKFWSLAGNLVQPIVDFGVLAHRQAAAQAALEQAKAQYQSTVLGAFQNVADCLYAIEQDGQALQAATDAEQIARKTLALTRRQAELGAVSRLAVLTARQAEVQARIGTVQARQARALDTVALHQALGGPL